MRDIPVASEKPGFAKVERCCRQALGDGIEFVWIDTCCIDKRSSAELSEAINSMFLWYQQSSVCYTFLADVPSAYAHLKHLLPNPVLNKHSFWNTGEVTDELFEDVIQTDTYDPNGGWLNLFRGSRWFTRGWTLQELIGPSSVLFFDCDWQYLGRRADLVNTLSSITGIDRVLLRHRSVSAKNLAAALASYSVAERMSWASNRKTTRMEDVAYCLLGLFDVHIPLLYGEGERAFRRLQEEIIKTSTDHSVFAWARCELHEAGRLLASSPKGFQYSARIVQLRRPICDESFEISNKGLKITLPLLPIESWPAQRDYIAVLNCRYRDDYSGPLALRLRGSTWELNDNKFYVYCGQDNADHARTEAMIDRLTVVEIRTLQRAQKQALLIARSQEAKQAKREVRPAFWIRNDLHRVEAGAVLVAGYPPECCNLETGVVDLSLSSKRRDQCMVLLDCGLSMNRFLCIQFGRSANWDRPLFMYYLGVQLPTDGYDAATSHLNFVNTPCVSTREKFDAACSKLPSIVYGSKAQSTSWIYCEDLGTVTVEIIRELVMGEVVHVVRVGLALELESSPDPALDEPREIKQYEADCE